MTAPDTDNLPQGGRSSSGGGGGGGGAGRVWRTGTRLAAAAATSNSNKVVTPKAPPPPPPPPSPTAATRPRGPSERKRFADLSPGGGAAPQSPAGERNNCAASGASANQFACFNILRLRSAGLPSRAYPPECACLYADSWNPRGQEIAFLCGMRFQFRVVLLALRVEMSWRF